MSDVAYPPADLSGYMTVAAAEATIAEIAQHEVYPMGTVAVAENATLAISAGVRKVTVPAPGVAPGKNYLLFPVAPTPPGYALADVIATALNTLVVTITAPLLALRASYRIECRVVQVGQ